MPATQVPVHHVVAEKARRLLEACFHAHSAEDYARRLVAAMTAEIPSAHAIWLDVGAASTHVVARSEGCEAVLDRMCRLSERAPVLANDLDPDLGITSIAAAPMRFRDAAAGVLAVANAADRFTGTDVEVLSETGRAALAEYEALVCAESLGRRTAQQTVADLVHEVRQPLSVMEACAYCAEGALPADEVKVRGLVLEMQKQLAAAGRILDEGTGGYESRRARTPVAGPEPEAESSRVFTNAAMSAVT